MNLNIVLLVVVDTQGYYKIQWFLDRSVHIIKWDVLFLIFSLLVESLIHDSSLFLNTHMIQKYFSKVDIFYSRK